VSAERETQPTDVVARANYAIGAGNSDQLHRDLLAEVDVWRDNYRRVLKAMLGNARVIGQLRDECGLSVEYVDSLVEAATAEAFAEGRDVS
jgi:hypothetical protein